MSVEATTSSPRPTHCEFCGGPIRANAYFRWVWVEIGKDDRGVPIKRRDGRGRHIKCDDFARGRIDSTAWDIKEGR